MKQNLTRVCFASILIHQFSSVLSFLICRTYFAFKTLCMAVLLVLCFSHFLSAEDAVNKMMTEDAIDKVKKNAQEANLYEALLLIPVMTDCRVLSYPISPEVKSEFDKIILDVSSLYARDLKEFQVSYEEIAAVHIRSAASPASIFYVFYRVDKENWRRVCEEF